MSLSDILVSVRDTFSRIYEILSTMVTNAMTNAGTNRHTELREEYDPVRNDTSVPMPDTASGANSVAASPIAQPESGTAAAGAAAATAATAASAAAVPVGAAAVPATAASAAVPETGTATSASAAAVPVGAATAAAATAASAVAPASAAAAAAAATVPATGVAAAAALRVRRVTHDDAALTAALMIKFILDHHDHPPLSRKTFMDFLLGSLNLFRYDAARNGVPFDPTFGGKFGSSIWGHLFNFFALGDIRLELLTDPDFMWDPSMGICLNPVEFVQPPQSHNSVEDDQDSRDDWTGNMSDARRQTLAELKGREKRLRGEYRSEKAKLYKGLNLLHANAYLPHANASYEEIDKAMTGYYRGKMVAIKKERELLRVADQSALSAVDSGSSNNPFSSNAAGGGGGGGGGGGDAHVMRDSNRICRSEVLSTKIA